MYTIDTSQVAKPCVLDGSELTLVFVMLGGCLITAVCDFPATVDLSR